MIDGMEGVGVVGGDIFDLQGIDTQSRVSEDQSFIFRGVQTFEDGMAFGAGAHWLVDFGDQTRVFGNIERSKGTGYYDVLFTVRINDGASVSAADYTAADFIL